MKKIVQLWISVLLFSSAASAQTVSSIGTAAVPAATDFATRAFQDPWDMSQRTDLGWFVNGTDQPVTGFAQPVTFANGEFVGTTINNNSYVELLETGNPNAARLGKTGYNYPIDANTYRYLAFRMSVATGPAVQFIWNRNDIYDGTTTTGYNVTTTPGYRVYLVDLTNLPNVSGPTAWSGVIRYLRMNTSFTAGDTVRFDWIRLVAANASACRTITWTGGGTVDIHLLNSSNQSLGLIASGVNGTSGNANSASPGCSTTGAGYKYLAGALEPGTYKVAVVTAGGTPTAANFSSGTWVVNDIPTLSFTSPDPEGSADDFATNVLSNPWDMNALTDLDLITNVSAPQITSLALENTAGTSLGSVSVFKGTSVSAAATGSIVGDPYVDPLFAAFGSRGFNNRIDTSRYRILTVEYGIPNLARSILNGSIARVVWRVAGQPAESVSDDIIVNHRAGANVLDKFTVDLADRAVLAIEQGQFAGVLTGGWENGNSSNPGVDIFRFDPHEFDNPTDFYIRRIKLAALEKAASSYTIRWQYSDAQAGTVNLYYSTSNTGSCTSGTPIASPGAATGQYSWNVAGLANGTYYVCASFTDGTNSNETWARWPIVKDSSFNGSLPRLAVNRSHLNYGVVARPNQTFPLVGTSAQTVRVSVVGGSGTPCWMVDNNLPATYAVTLSGGGSQVCGSGSFTVALNSGNPFNVVGQGSATFTVREVTAGTTTNSPQYVTAFHRIVGAGDAPAGLVDTPLQGAVVSGSIPVTGWATDDIDIATIGIYRDPVGAETGLVFVGNAVRVDDARSDIEAANPTTPFNYRGGWGYLVLTNFLPGGGDGSYTLHVIATDVEGRQTTLGSRLIVGANSASTRPFGAIDTPAQGEVITGSTSYNNFGWVLSRGMTKASPFYGTGASVVVVIDGVAVGSPTGWTSRGDLTALFPKPQFDGIDRALGVYTFNPSALALGVHTIAWGVTADNGQADGIGSRYFTTASGSGLMLGSIEAPARHDNGPDLGRRASAVGTIAAIGPQTVIAGQMARVVVDPFRGRKGDYHAYLVANGELRQLPVGASFDPAKGVIYWQPGVGYRGAYDFVVVRDGRERVPVRVVLEPRHPAPPRTFDIRFSADAGASSSGLR